MNDKEFAKMCKNLPCYCSYGRICSYCKVLDRISEREEE